MGGGSFSAASRPITVEATAVHTSLAQTGLSGPSMSADRCHGGPPDSSM